MAGKRRLSEDELALWQAVAKSVTPLRRKRPQKKVVDSEAAPEAKAAPTKAPPAKRPKAPNTALPAAPAAKPAPVPAPLTPNPAPGAMPGIDKRQAERFRRGQMTIEGKIDLHGRTQAEAHDALQHFIEHYDTAGSGKICLPY